MDIRPVTSADEAAVGDLVAGDRRAPLFGPDAEEPRLRRGVVAEDRGDIAGVAVGLTSARHPARNELAVYVHPSRRRQGVATTLLNHLSTVMSDAGPPRPWDALIDAANQDGRAFLEARGFHLVVSSRSGGLDLTRLRLPADPLPRGHRIEPAESSDPAIVDPYESLDDENHWWTNGYVRYARGRSRLSFVGEPVPGTTFAAFDVFGAPIAVLGLAGEDPERRTAFLVPGGALHGARRLGADTIVAHLLHRVVSAAVDRGLASVTWEADDTHVELRAVLESLPIEITERLEVFADG
jgi:GNAT superfamily N-acetyltransferase